MKEPLLLPTTRREFLKNSSKVAGLLAFGSYAPSFLAKSVAAGAPRPEKDRSILVLIQLAGGNDGLNTVIPLEDDRYHKLRPTLGIKKKETIKFSDQLGFHPSFEGLKGLMDSGEMGIVQNVGYPNPNRSHFRSMEIWESASDSDTYETTGWVGRFLDNSCGGVPGDADPDALVLGNEMPLTFQGDDSHHLFSINDVNSRRRGNRPSKEMSMISGDHHGNLGFLEQTMMDTLMTEERIQNLFAQSRRKKHYPGTRLARSLERVATLIQSDLPTRVYFVSHGGFDTHVNQQGTHQRLLRELSDAVVAFQNDLKSTGHQDQVLTTTFSEFGRRPSQNQSGGTDHGTAAPLFLFGSQLKNRLVGESPNLDVGENQDIQYSTDFREVYATILDHWLGCDSSVVLGGKFDHLPMI